MLQVGENQVGCVPTHQQSAACAWVSFLLRSAIYVLLHSHFTPFFAVFQLEFSNSRR